MLSVMSRCSRDYRYRDYIICNSYRLQRVSHVFLDCKPHVNISFLNENYESFTPLTSGTRVIYTHLCTAYV